MTKDRKVGLLIDNASCHGNSKTIPKIQNVEVIYLPAKTTALIQSLDAGSIAALKRKYRRRQVLRALSFVGDDSKSIYNVGQLTAMNWVQNIW